MSLLTPTIISELETLYSHPNRHYHNLTHVNALLSLLDRYRSHFSDPQAVEAAIWFHDAIYDPRAKGYDNEIQSAELAVERLRASGVDIGEERVAAVRMMIEATATHKLPRDLVVKGIAGGKGDDDQQAKNAGLLNDVTLFLDMDLSILGADPKEFEEYEEAVRKEYAWVDDEGWRKGRAAVLRGLLPSPSSSSSFGVAVVDESMSNPGQEERFIFHSKLFRELLEEKARVNIRTSLERLGAC